VIGFENISYTIIEGDNSDLCITVKEPRDATLDFIVPTLIASQDGSAIGKSLHICTCRSCISFMDIYLSLFLSCSHSRLCCSAEYNFSLRKNML